MANRSLEGTHPNLAKFTHLAHSKEWGSFEERFERNRIDRDVAEATLEYIEENAENLRLNPPKRKDYEEPIPFFRRLANYRGEQQVLDLLNHVVTNRLYGVKVDEIGDDGLPPPPLSEKAIRRRAREAQKQAKRGKVDVKPTNSPTTPVETTQDRETARITAKNAAKSQKQADKAGKAARKEKAKEKAR